MHSSWKIARGALLSALCWLLLMAAASLPTGRFFVLTLASFLIAVACQELGLSGAGLVYLASSFLALLWPGLVIALLFAFCFGLQPLMIYFFRRHFKPWLTRLLTHLLMTALCGLLIYFVGLDQVFKPVFQSSGLILAGLTLLALQLFLFIYYYVLQLFEVFYKQRLAPWLRRKG